MSNELIPYEDKDIFETVKEIITVLNQHTFQLDEIRSSLELAEKRKSILLTLEEKTDDNMKRLNAMMLELKGIIAMVRPKVKNSGWYGEEINTIDKNDKNKHDLIDLKLIE